MSILAVNQKKKTGFEFLGKRSWYAFRVRQFYYHHEIGILWSIIILMFAVLIAWQAWSVYRDVAGALVWAGSVK